MSPTDKAPNTGKRPVFLHTGWRSAGTWVWSCFRELRKVRAYYEPFHAALAWDAKALGEIRAESWDSGHPAMEEPYFQEFFPLVKPEGGVRGYLPSFELDRFDLAPKEEAPDLKIYLDGLLAAAEAEGRVPVFKFCRSMGRLPWMRHAYPGAVHVAVIRNPAGQWSSYWGQLQKNKNPWFMAAPYRVLGGNLGVEKVQRAVRAFGLDEGSLETLAGQAEAEASESVKALPAGLSYRTHLAHWTLCQMSLEEGIDGLLDSDLLALSKTYGAHCTAHLGELAGIRPDFADAQPARAAGTARSAMAWMGIEAKDAMDAHFVASAFAEGELGGTNPFALSVIQSKLALANQQAWLGGAAYLMPPGGIGAHAERCADPFAIPVLLQMDRPVAPKRTVAEAVVETTMGLAGRGARAFRRKRRKR